MGSPFKYSSPDEALTAWQARVPPIEEHERLELIAAIGRVLAQSVQTDRPSPPCSVSAMDGYVMRLGDLSAGRVEVACEVAIGQPPPVIPTRNAGRIFTGAPVPDECDVVIKREDVQEHGDHFEIEERVVASIKAEQHIRRRGENASEGTKVLSSARVISTTTTSALAAFGYARVDVMRRLRVGVITTGSELRRADESDIAPWEIRNSNGPAIEAFLRRILWIELKAIEHAVDDAELIATRLSVLLNQCDAVMLTGGVSMGDYDFVIGAVNQCAGEVVFHKLPVRPGKPVLAAVGERGQVIFGLPGNPVSVMVALRTLGYQMLQHKAGIAHPTGASGQVQLHAGPDQSLNLWWYRPVRLTGSGQAELVPIRGSGDVVATALSDGIVQLPPGESSVGPWPYWPWNPL